MRSTIITTVSEISFPPAGRRIGFTIDEVRPGRYELWTEGKKTLKTLNQLEVLEEMQTIMHIIFGEE